MEERRVGRKIGKQRTHVGLLRHMLHAPPACMSPCTCPAAARPPAATTPPHMNRCKSSRRQQASRQSGASASAPAADAAASAASCSACWASRSAGTAGMRGSARPTASTCGGSAASSRQVISFWHAGRECAVKPSVVAGTLKQDAQTWASGEAGGRRGAASAASWEPPRTTAATEACMMGPAGRVDCAAGPPGALRATGRAQVGGGMAPGHVSATPQTLQASTESLALRSLAVVHCERPCRRHRVTANR